MMDDYNLLIRRETALSHPFANGLYDHEHANPEFIRGHESYREWLEDLPPVQTCYGYPLSMLAFLAGLIQDSGMTPYEFINKMRESEEIARMTVECIRNELYKPTKEKLGGY